MNYDDELKLIQELRFQIDCAEKKCIEAAAYEEAMKTMTNTSNSRINVLVLRAKIEADNEYISEKLDKIRKLLNSGSI